MPATKSVRELNAPDLVKKWKVLVNDHVNMGRDSHLLAELLKICTPVQVLLGMYQFKGQANISIPIFTRNMDEWIEVDEEWAEVELARHISNSTPSDYYIFMDMRDSWDAQSFQTANEHMRATIRWADRVLS